MDYHRTTLPNGLRVITIPMPAVKSVTALVMVGAGSRYEEARINGISHFLEHMAFKGTMRRPTALSIASEIDGIGGEFNAFTSKDHTGYYIKSATEHLPQLLDVLSDMLLHSLFDAKEVEKEKGVIIEEINMYEDTPMRKIGDIYESLLYGDTPLGRDIAGRKEVIRSVTREDFIAYIDRFYGPANTVVAIAGGVEKNSEFRIQNSETAMNIVDVVAHFMGDWKKKNVEKPEAMHDGQKEPAVVVRYKDTQQAHVALGVRSYPLTHPNRYTLGVLTAILGGGMSSRLFVEVREKRGLAYYVRSGNEQYTDVGSFVTQAGVDVARIDDAIQVMIAEFMHIRQAPVAEEELHKAKEYLKGKLTLELEDSRSVAGMFASDELLEEKIVTPEEVIKKIDTVTSKDIQEVAHDIFRPEWLNLAVIGPYKSEERFKKLLE